MTQSEKPTITDRRHFRRVNLSAPILVRSLAGGPQQKGLTESVSLGGVNLTVPYWKSISLNEQMIVSLLVPQRLLGMFPFSRMCGKGHVVRAELVASQKPPDKNRVSLAIAFDPGVAVLGDIGHFKKPHAAGANISAQEKPELPKPVVVSVEEPEDEGARKEEHELTDTSEVSVVPEPAQPEIKELETKAGFDEFLTKYEVVIEPGPYRKGLLIINGIQIQISAIESNLCRRMARQLHADWFLDKLPPHKWGWFSYEEFEEAVPEWRTAKEQGRGILDNVIINAIDRLNEKINRALKLEGQDKNLIENGRKIGMVGHYRFRVHPRSVSIIEP